MLSRSVASVRRAGMDQHKAQRRGQCVWLVIPSGDVLGLVWGAVVYPVFSPAVRCRSAEKFLVRWLKEWEADSVQ